MRVLMTIVLALGMLSFSVRARADTDFGHAWSLPRLNPGTVLDAVPGDLPGPEHPRGTVIVVASLEKGGPTLLEWDIARTRVVRRSSLALPQSDVDVRMARAGLKLQVIAMGKTLVLCQVDVASFRIDHRIDLGPATYSEVATDGAMTVVAMNPQDDEALGTWSVVTVDGAGHVRGRMTGQGILGYSPNVRLAVLGDRAFVILAAEPPIEPRPRLVALNADATVERQIVLDTLVTLPSLAVKGNRLLVANRKELLELSPELNVLARHAVSVGGRLAVSADGRVLTGEGDILSDTFSPERRVGCSEAWVHAVLWVGSTPLALGSAAEVVRSARLHWWDAAVP
jgi:hypothetical protein